jgi:hypothetical protein
MVIGVANLEIFDLAVEKFLRKFVTGFSDLVDLEFDQLLDTVKDFIIMHLKKIRIVLPFPGIYSMTTCTYSEVRGLDFLSSFPWR